MRHLGDRVAPLVDGRMTPAEEERAWTHVHGCPLCTEAVQREGWVKRRLAGLSSYAGEEVPAELRGTLSDPTSFAAYPAPYDAPGPHGRRRLTGLAVLGAGSVSAAMMGVVALGAGPANTPAQERRAPASVTVFNPTAPSGRTSTQRSASDLSGLDATTAARRVAATVGAGMRMGL